VDKKTKGNRWGGTVAAFQEEKKKEGGENDSERKRVLNF